ncbi:uncharacterized protein MELLADRAFT_91188 [Melampsora larici-populina 98AG31]|uniref:Uncharacterized protein n=1 Tax=Melampsora larici-populina (strain 98AG31 / pathotype 3-4-7) TaxID=747676 RepID=F4RY52_MELLP|nr:uncharacterized protein MELLADRAFT_91188 [Melampsora larici-populina 98AG31]EGG02701.1 hypothetical protein MELLADRAFT_91188 [Melampsora larici-populina 98AG31]
MIWVDQTLTSLCFLPAMPYKPIQNWIHKGKNPEEVFDLAYLIADGDKAPACHPTLKRLWRQGTESRSLMEESQSFIIGVTFKIHTKNMVEVPLGIAKQPAPSKLTTGKKKPPPPPKFAIIDSSDFKDRQVLDFKIFMYGKSLNKLKDLVGDMCDRYFTGIKKVVLHSELTLLLNWNASIGSKKTKLIDFKIYQELVNNLGKSCSSKGIIHIMLEKPQVKENKNTQASGAVAFIQGTAGPNTIEAELTASKEETVAAKEETVAVKAAKELELDAVSIYQDHLKRALRAVCDGLTTRGISPNTVKYKREMFKNALVHKDMNVKDHVKKCYPVATPRAKQTTLKQRNFFANTPPVEMKIKVEPISPSGSKHDLKINSSSSEVASHKKVKKEPSNCLIEAAAEADFQNQPSTSAN